MSPEEQRSALGVRFRMEDIMLKEIKEGILLSLPIVCFMALVIFGFKGCIIIAVSLYSAYQMFKILDKDDFSKEEKCYKIKSGEKMLKM